MIDPALFDRLLGLSTALKDTLAEVTLVANTRTPASATPLPTDHGLWIQPHPDNVGYVRVGGVNTDATHGMVIPAGMIVPIPCDDASDVYYWTDTGGNRVNALVF